MEGTLTQVHNFASSEAYMIKSADLFLYAAEKYDEYFRKHSASRDRLYELCQAIDHVDAAAARQDSIKERDASPVPTTSAAPGGLKRKASEPAEAPAPRPAKSPRRRQVKQENDQDEEQQTTTEGATRQRAEKGNGRAPSPREAAIKAITFWMKKQTVDQMRALISAAGITTTLLSYDAAHNDRTLRDKEKGHKMPSQGWSDNEEFKKAQLQFFLGRAMIEQFDKVTKPNSQADKVYHSGSYQNLWVGKDVNGNSRLVRGMMACPDCSMPTEAEDEFIHNAAYVQGLLKLAADFEVTSTNGVGHFPKYEDPKVGCALTEALEKAALEEDARAEAEMARIPWPEKAKKARASKAANRVSEEPPYRRKHTYGLTSSRAPRTSRTTMQTTVITESSADKRLSRSMLAQEATTLGRSLPCELS